MNIARGPALLLTVILFTPGLPAHAQSAGFATLYQSFTPASAALGGIQLTQTGQGPLSAFENPALPAHETHHNAGLAYQGSPGGAKTGRAGYSFTHEKAGVFTLGVQGTTFGEMPETLDNGDETGRSFRAAENWIGLAWSGSKGPWSYGLNLMHVNAVIDEYGASGVVLGGGAHWQDSARQIHIGASVHSLGTETDPFQGRGWDAVPFELRAGISKKLTHAPFRFTLTVRDIQQWDQRYKDEAAQTTSGFGENTQASSDNDWVKNAARHLNLGTEVILGPGFQFRFGYAPGKRMDLRYLPAGGGAGFSYGLMIKTGSLAWAYTTSRTHPAGNFNQLGLTYQF